MLKDGLQVLLSAHGIEDTALFPFAECRVEKGRLLEEKEGFCPCSVILFLLPYYTETPDNFSAYAVSRDYHFYLEELQKTLISRLEKALPSYRFYAFTDHSPIDEREAAVRAGLGVLGQNGLLLTEKYGSFQFIAEIFTDAPLSLLGEADIHPFATCHGCGACKAACPTGILRGEGEECLSAITQKKGALSKEERLLMQRHHTAWGCDICQNVCPYNQRAKESGTIYTKIPYFLEGRVTSLSSALLLSMRDEEFRQYAFAWRGKKTVLRNTGILEEDT